MSLDSQTMEIDPALALEIAALGRQRKAMEVMSRGNSEIQNFYSGSTVFITGGTGFLGKPLIEKILRSCPRIERVYLLVRPKKGKEPRQRIEQIVSDPLFNELRKIQPNFSEKLTPIMGDIDQIGLGMSTGDFNSLSESVNVIFHGAATVRFDDPIKKAVITNIRGTREVLHLAKSCQNLKALIHISTAYSNYPRQEISERFYDIPIPYDVMIKMVENMDTNRLEAMTKTLLGTWPNTYTFTKVLAEEAVRQLSNDIPCAIVRPAIVAATYRDPAPGWVDMSSVFGPSGVILGSGMGIMHTFLANLNMKLDLVPADFVNNCCIAAAYRTAVDYQMGATETNIYNYVSSNRNPLTWKRIVDISNVKARELITEKAAWYCFNTIQPNLFLFSIMTLLWHTIPAYVADGVSVLIGKKPQFRQLYTTMYKMTLLLSVFNLREWDFNDGNTQKLFKSLSKEDQTIYDFEIANLEWVSYIQLWYLGLRRYIVKDDLKNTMKGVRRQFWFRIAHYLVVCLYVYGFWSLLSMVCRVAGFASQLAFGVAI